MKIIQDKNLTYMKIIQDKNLTYTQLVKYNWFPIVYTNNTGITQVRIRSLFKYYDIIL